MSNRWNPMSWQLCPRPRSFPSCEAWLPGSTMRTGGVGWHPKVVQVDFNSKKMSNFPIIPTRELAQTTNLLPVETKNRVTSPTSKCFSSRLGHPQASRLSHLQRVPSKHRYADHICFYTKSLHGSEQVVRSVRPSSTVCSQHDAIEDDLRRFPRDVLVRHTHTTIDQHWSRRNTKMIQDFLRNASPKKSGELCSSSPFQCVFMF